MEIKIPDFLKESENDIHSRMLENGPSDINIIEGDFFWDATKPTAIEVYNLKNITMQHFLKLVFLQSSEKNFLDMIGAEYGFERKPATKAVQIIRVSGKANTKIEAGKKVSTKSTDEQSSTQFQFIETGYINADGYVDLKAECLSDGEIGNILPGNITLLITPITGVSGVNNLSIYDYGVEEEDDETFRKQILNHIKEPSVAGNVADYKRWCNSFTGVGGTKVFPLWNGKGTVKCVIMSSESKAVTPSLISEVAAYIETVRPIGPVVTVESAKEKAINISAILNINTLTNLDTIKAQFKEKVVEYFQSIAFEKNNVSFAIIGSLLLECDGVNDYLDYKLNDFISNVSLTEDEVPILGNINLTLS